MLKRILVIAAALVFACPANADPKEPDDPKLYATVGDWQVRQVNLSHAPACAAMWAVDGMATSVIYDAKSGEVVLWLENAKATSVADGQTVKLDITFTKGSGVDNGWGEREFTVKVDDDGTRSFMSKAFTTEMLDDFAKQEYLLIDYDHKLVSGAKLDHSAVMVAKLRECSVKAAGLNADDPFLPK